MEGFAACFADLTDPRTGNAGRHDLLEMLVIALCSVLSGGKDCTDMAEFAASKIDFLRGFLRLEHGAPSHDTFSRLFRLLDPEQFRACFQRFMARFGEACQGVVAIDGKVLRRSFDTASQKSALHMVSAWGCEQQLVLAQIATEEKSNEITAIPKLLRLLDLRGATVTVDALNCQRAIAQQIVAQEGDYVMALKGNQQSLHDDVRLFFAPLASKSLMGGGFLFRMPCLGLLKVAALTPPDWQVTIIDEKVEPLDLNQEADLVGITAMTTTVHRGYEIADHFRQRGIKVVMGGMHVSCLPDEALQHCDSVIVGEAEVLWPALLRDFKKNELKPVYRHEDDLPPLVQLPRPDWELYRAKNYLPVHLVETTRGCPIDCEFCAVTSAFGGKYRNRAQEEVLAELHGLRPFEGLFTLKNCVFFVDDNIISNRAYAREFLARIADLNLHWFGQASMNIANEPEILKLCQKSGCTGLFLGFETLSPETLASVGKRVNRPDKYLEVVQKFTITASALTARLCSVSTPTMRAFLTARWSSSSRPSSKWLISPSSRRIPARVCTGG